MLQYFIQMTVEDGSMVVGARLGAQFLRELLGEPAWQDGAGAVCMHGPP